jgi:hypothetical protein
MLCTVTYATNCWTDVISVLSFHRDLRVYIQLEWARHTEVFQAQNTDISKLCTFYLKRIPHDVHERQYKDQSNPCLYQVYSLFKIVFGKPDGRENLEDLISDERILLKQTFKKLCECELDSRH